MARAITTVAELEILLQQLVIIIDLASVIRKSSYMDVQYQVTLALGHAVRSRISHQRISVGYGNTEHWSLRWSNRRRIGGRVGQILHSPQNRGCAVCHQSQGGKIDGGPLGMSWAIWDEESAFLCRKLYGEWNERPAHLYIGQTTCRFKMIVGGSPGRGIQLALSIKM